MHTPRCIMVKTINVNSRYITCYLLACCEFPTKKVEVDFWAETLCKYMSWYVRWLSHFLRLKEASNCREFPQSFCVRLLTKLWKQTLKKVLKQLPFFSNILENVWPSSGIHLWSCGVKKLWLMSPVTHHIFQLGFVVILPVYLFVRFVFF